MAHKTRTPYPTISAQVFSDDSEYTATGSYDRDGIYDVTVEVDGRDPVGLETLPRDLQDRLLRALEDAIANERPSDPDWDLAYELARDDGRL